jgi:intracellular multiplication protein IcmO
VRGRFFFANPAPVKELRLNHFLKVDIPEDADVRKMTQSFEHFDELLNNGVTLEASDLSNEEVDSVCQLLAEGSDLPLIDNSALVMQSFNVHVEAFSSSFFEEPNETYEEHLTVFKPMRRSNQIMNVVMSDDLDIFGRSVLDRADTRDYVEYTQRLLGKSGQQAMNIALEIVGDMQKGTDYPPNIKPLATPSEVAADVAVLIDAIVLKKRDAASTSE